MKKTIPFVLAITCFSTQIAFAKSASSSPKVVKETLIAQENINATKATHEARLVKLKEALNNLWSYFPLSSFSWRFA